MQLLANSPGKEPGNPDAWSTMLLPCKIQLCHRRGGSCRRLPLNQGTQVFTGLYHKVGSTAFPSKESHGQLGNTGATGRSAVILQIGGGGGVGEKEKF